MKLFFFLLIFTFSLVASENKIGLLYRSIDPQSIAEHLAFYQLFPNTIEGKKALEEAWKLLSGSPQNEKPIHLIPMEAVEALVALVTKSEGEKTLTLSQTDLQVISDLGKRLLNRKLKGYYVNSEKEVLALPTEEVDLAHGLLLAQAEEDSSIREKMASYEALLDLMALQILTKISLEDPPEKKIRAINSFIFEDMCYRFPPHSVFAKNVDVYTYLPTVIDSRRGVCLGVSILYLALSQRLGLPLGVITPPGHIYVRYEGYDKTINIETTARGIHIDSEEYLGIELPSLQSRTIKEVIGMAYFNEASVHWQNQNYEKALKCYERAKVYFPQDPILRELMGYNYLFTGEFEKGRDLLKEVMNENRPHYQLVQKSVIEDFLKGKVDAEGIRTVFLHVDEKRESLLKKKNAVENTLQAWPQFRAGYFHLAILWLQLNREGEALKQLEKYESLEKNDPTAEYLLSQLYAMRLNMPKAWEHLHRVQALLSDREKLPKTIQNLQKQLAKLSPE